MPAPPDLNTDHRSAGRRLSGRIVGMAGVSHHDGGRLRKVVASESRDPMRTDRRRHPCAGRTAPQGIVPGTDTERFGIPENVGDGGRHVLSSNRTAMAHPVSQDEGVISQLADLQGVGEAFVDGADIGKPATGSDHRKGRSGPSTEEEQPRMLSRRFRPLLRFGVEVVEHGFPGVHIVDHVIQSAYHHLRIHMTVIRQQ